MEDRKINTNIDEVKVQDSDQVKSALSEESLEDVNGGAFYYLNNRGLSEDSVVSTSDGETKLLKNSEKSLLNMVKTVVDDIDPEEKLKRFSQDKSIFKNNDKLLF